MVAPDYGYKQQYYGRLGIGAGTPGAAAGYLRGQYNPLRALYGIEERFAPFLDEGAGQGSWQNYLRPSARLTEPLYRGRRAQNILSQLVGQSPTGRAERGMTWGPTYDEFGQATREVSQAEQQDLLSMALASRWGPRGAARFAGRLPVEEELWMEGQAGGATTPFLNWLNTKYGLA